MKRARTQERWLDEARAFAEALFSTDDGPPPSERLDWLMVELADFIEQAGARTEFIMRAGLGVATWAAPPLVGNAPPLARVPVEARARALERLERSPFGLPLLAVKAILCILYYEHPDVLREAGIVTNPGETRPGCMGARSKEVAS
ncbi:MAG: hypothetical protein U0271_04625 [Polyangiaceae bacterium]